MVRAFATLAALAVVIPTAANAARWVLVTKTPNAARYIDADAFVFDEATATIWLKTDYASKGKSGESVTIEKWMHDCANARAKLLALTLYDAKGRVVGSAELPRYRLEWGAIIPNSIGETIHQRVCGIVNGPVQSRDAEETDLETVS